MAILKKNDKGIMAINNDLLRSTIIDDIRGEDDLVLCNKKGAPVKKTFFGGPDDIRNSVIIRDNKENLSIAIFFLINVYNDADNIAENIIAKVSNLLDAICINRPCIITCKYKGIIDKDGNITERDTEFNSRYECH